MRIILLGILCLNGLAMGINLPFELINKSQQEVRLWFLNKTKTQERPFQMILKSGEKINRTADPNTLKIRIFKALSNRQDSSSIDVEFVIKTAQKINVRIIDTHQNNIGLKLEPQEGVIEFLSNLMITNIKKEEIKETVNT